MAFKPIRTAAVLAVAGFAAAWLASPLWAAYQLTEAVERRDAEAISRHVDFPAFRASLKDQASARLLSRLEAETGLGGELGGLGRVLAPSLAPGLVSGLVDAAVTPDMVAAIIETGESPLTPDGRRREGGGERRGEVKRAWSYRGLNLFAVTLSRDDEPEEKLALLLERRGLFDWKLAGVDLDPGAHGP